MNRNGPIIIIEDDVDDKDLLEEIFIKLNFPNERLYFEDGVSALEYLTTLERNPFIIISDINLPKLNGIELRSKLKTDAALELKCIPYIFFTTNANHKAVVEAYSLSVQGFFVKPNSMLELEKVMLVIIEYWKLCVSPGSTIDR